MFGMIFTSVVFGLCAVIMISIGVAQLKSREPVGFYTGEKAPTDSEITNTNEWNRKHGWMWISYGGAIVLSWICGMLIGDSVWALIPLFVGICGPIPIMIAYHEHLNKVYRCKQNDKPKADA